MNPDFAGLDVFLRGGAVTTLLLCATLFARRPGQSRKACAVIALALALCAYLLVSTPNLPVPHGGMRLCLVLFAGTVPALVYWVAIELFLDHADIRGWQVALGLAAILSAWLALYLPAAGLVRGVLVLALLAHLLLVVISGDAGDLIESRRRFRRWFLLIIVALGAAITAIELSGADRQMPDVMFALHGAIFLTLTLAFLVWATQIAPDVWLDTRHPPNRSTAANPAQAALVARVREAMARDVWREEGLTISQLATRLGSQEHRLRRAINQGLGFRNFSQFINSYRIAAAQVSLGDPARADVTILSIAYDVGFASLGPFNRAFRDVTGMTPSEYRRIHAGRPDTDSYRQ